MRAGGQRTPTLMRSWQVSLSRLQALEREQLLWQRLWTQDRQRCVLRRQAIPWQHYQRWMERDWQLGWWRMLGRQPSILSLPSLPLLLPRLQ